MLKTTRRIDLKHQVILVYLEKNVACCVILDRVIVYNEDDDKYARNRYFPASAVAMKLANVLKSKMSTVELTYEDVSAEEWTFNALKNIALKKVGCRTKR